MDADKYIDRLLISKANSLGQGAKMVSFAAEYRGKARVLIEESL